MTRLATVAQRAAQTARIVRACASGKNDRTVASGLVVSEATVCKWRGRFLKHWRVEANPGNSSGWKAGDDPVG